MSAKVILGLVAVLVVVGAAVIFVSKSSKNPYQYPSQPTGNQNQPTNQPTQLESPTPAGSTTVPQTSSITLTTSGFAPQSLTVKVGTKVVWTNNSGAAAAVNSGSHPTHLVYPPLNLGNFTNGETLALVFDQPGTYRYHNHLNASQTGIVVVE